MYGAKGPENRLGMIPVVLLGVACFAGLGFGAAALIRSAEGASAVVNLIVLPMAFLSGSFGPTRRYPEVLQWIADVLPLTYLIDLMKQVYLLRRVVPRASRRRSRSSPPGARRARDRLAPVRLGAARTMITPARRSIAVLFAVLWVGQATAAGPLVPVPPAGALPDMKSRARPLRSVTLVAEAVDHAGLRRVLESGGYVAGSEREFFGGTSRFNHVTEQVLRFRRSAGASGYLRWLRAHVDDELGAPRSVTASEVGTSGFVYRPRGCGCHSDKPTYLIAWQQGRLVLTVLASGNGATARTVDALAHALDGAVT